MKLVTEFASFTLNKALKMKTSLLGEGKSPEEVQQSLGETFKLEGDKLKHFVNALDVAGQNPENLKRVLVVTLAEGENAPAKSTKVEDTHYAPEFLISKSYAEAQKSRGTQNKGRGRDSKKGSPWGLTPEEKAAKGSGGPKPPKSN